MSHREPESSLADAAERYEARSQEVDALLDFVINAVPPCGSEFQEE